MSYPREALVALAEAVRVLHSAPHPLPAVREALPWLAGMLGAEGWEELRPAAPCLWLGSWTAAARSAEIAALQLETEPAVVWELFCPMGRTDQLSVSLRLGVEGLGLSFCRPGGFGAGEARLMALFLEHVTMAAGGAGRRADLAKSSAGEWALRVSASGELGPVGTDLILLLQRYWPDKNSPVPAAVRQWVTAQQARRRPGAAGTRGPAWCIAQPWGRLHLQLEWAAAGAAVLRGWEERGAADYRRLRARGLTQRECEVVFWVAQGKRDAEIATILATAPRTIGKHVEHVLEKLGVESRAAATAAAQAWLEQAG